MVDEKKKFSVEEFDTLDEGILFRFRGAERDENDEPIGEMVDVELIIPPHNFYNMRRMRDKLKALKVEKDTASLESMDIIIDLVVPALRQNYRNVPRWLVDQTIKADNMMQIMEALMDVSGLKRKEAAEKKVKAAAEPPAQTLATSGSGTASIPT
jgi:hypothetical protein